MNVSKLNLEEDKPYIVHQILAYGTLDEIKWLMKTYGKDVVKKVFLNQPIKVYTPPALKFSQLLLDIPAVRADRYDQTLPRNIG